MSFYSLSKNRGTPVHRDGIVLLPREANSGTQSKVSFASETPDHGTGLTVELVNGPRMARRDQQVAVHIEADRVEMKVLRLRCGGG